MNTKKKPGPESIVREIKRRTRRKYSAEEKIRIVLEGLRGEQSITDLSRREGIHSGIYYKWSKAFLEAGKQRLSGDTVREAGSNELWQTDFTYLKVTSWGWYYLLTVLDDYSRYIIAWQLCKTMKAEDVKITLDQAIAKTGVQHIHVYHRPKLLSDNGPCFISMELKNYLSQNDMRHIRIRTYHPMTQGKIERYHRSMKNLILLDHYYSPSELEERIREWVDYYNNHRYHEAIDNVTPSDRFYGKDKEILEQRQRTKTETMSQRRKIYRSFLINNLMGDLN